MLSFELNKWLVARLQDKKKRIQTDVRLANKKRERERGLK